MKEKQKETPNLKKICKLRNPLEDIENYKKQGTVIRSKEQKILQQEQPLEIIQKNETKTITNSFEILKEWKKCYKELYAQSTTNQNEQNKFLENIKTKIIQQQNQNLTKPMAIK